MTMKKIMFNDKYGLTQAVLDGRKTMTRRICKYDRPDETYDIVFPVFEPKDYDDNGNIIEGTTVVYKEKDLINNNTLELSTLAKNKLLRPGVANLAKSNINRFQLTIDNNGESGSDYNVQIEGIEGGVTIIEGNGSYIAQSPTYTFNSGDKPCPEVNLNYTYELAGKRYKVKEQLVLRRDPVNDLRVESWK